MGMAASQADRDDKQSCSKLSFSHWGPVRSVVPSRGSQAWPGPYDDARVRSLSPSPHQGLKRSKLAIYFPLAEGGYFFLSAIVEQQRVWLGWMALAFISTSW